jgi:hypothetical protein
MMGHWTEKYGWVEWDEESPPEVKLWVPKPVPVVEHQTKHEPAKHSEPAKHPNPEPAKHGQVSKHRNASTWTAEQARKNGAKGGENRKLVVSKIERSEIARQGAQARWMKKDKGEQNT